MNFITRQNYLDYMKKITATMLKEESDEYVLEDFKGTEYNYQKVQEINKKHDKIFKLIFTRKNEVANFLNQYLQLKEVIKEEQLVECSTEFIIEEYKERQADVVYKLKDKLVYFLIEHQSTVNSNMIERIGKYIEGIMIKVKSNNLLYPIVVPIVVYTGFQKWNAKTKFIEKQYRIKE